VGFGCSVSTVLSPGEFSRRGDVVDIFRQHCLTNPLRFFGGEIESLRSFDQRRSDR
jgi:transcription-repair coupling factor (superfamily II helicase)